MIVNIKKIVMLGLCWVALEGMQNPVRAKLDCRQAIRGCKDFSNTLPYNTITVECKKKNYAEACRLLKYYKYCELSECEPWPPN